MPGNHVSFQRLALTQNQAQRQRLTNTVSLFQTHECSFDERRRRAWNIRNANWFSMAPSALVENGDVDDENYPAECGNFRRNADAHLIAEAELIEPHIPKATIWLVGVGQRDDFGFIPHVLKKDMVVHIADHSRVVLPQAFEFLKQLAPLPHGFAPDECVHLADFRYVLHELLEPYACWLHSSRTIHHNSWTTQRAIWKGIGQFLSGQGYFEEPPDNRRFTIINPDARDNEGWLRDHAKARKSKMYYRSVNAFNVDEHALPAISKAAHRTAQIVRQSEKFEFFGEWMRASTIMLARS